MAKGAKKTAKRRTKRAKRSGKRIATTKKPAKKALRKRAPGPTALKSVAKRSKPAGSRKPLAAAGAAAMMLPRSMPVAGPGLNFAGGIERFVDESPDLRARVTALEQNVCITVALPAVGGEPIQHHKSPLQLGNFENFRPRPDARQLAVEELKAQGFTIVRQGRFGVTIKGPARLVSDVCKTRLVVQARPGRVGLRASQDFAADFTAPHASELFITPTESLTISAGASKHIDHFIFTPPPIYFQDPNPPPHAFHGVNEAGIRRILNVPADKDGVGVRVALVDTGFYPHHYYSSRGLSYSVSATAGAPTPEIDNVGHGTAIAYNVFAVAPGVDLVGYQQTDPPQDALESAADEGADIISCSWGWEDEQIFNIVQASILSIVAEGKIVLFAAGNGQRAWPGSQPEVLSIGGVYSDKSGALEASNFASGFLSDRFAERRTPDVCGLCGQRPKGIYLMLPTQPGSAMDKGFAGPAFPYQDETGPNDGWVGASGTSSATPQVAGVVALMVQKARAKGLTLDTPRVREILEQTSLAITKGSNAMRETAAGQPNNATGWGLVNAEAALALI